jgi:hypothetical protein
MRLAAGGMTVVVFSGRRYQIDPGLTEWRLGGKLPRVALSH